MKRVTKHFNDLSKEELYEILKIRTAIFVVEQNCPYQEVDGKDLVSYHLWLEDEEGIEAYARVLPAEVSYEYVSIGRVLSKKRRQGLGLKIVNEAIQLAKEKFGAGIIRIEAQSYAKELYEKAGFVQVSKPFMEDGIEHILMDYKSI